MGGVTLKITMARRDDIVKRQQEWDNLNKQNNAELNEYRTARKSVFNALEELIRDKIGPTPLSLNIRVDESVWSGLEVRIDNGDHPHDEQALNWNWSAVLTQEGELKKDSGSWSGLSATTPEQISNLKASVKVLEILNNLDWNTLLTVELPKYEDYVKTKVPKGENFNQQILEADVLDAMDEGLLIKGHGYKYYNPRAVVFYHILKENPKSFTVQEIHEDDLSDESRWTAPYTIQKDKLYSVVDNPIKTAEV